MPSPKGYVVLTKETTSRSVTWVSQEENGYDFRLAEYADGTTALYRVYRDGSIDIDCESVLVQSLYCMHCGEPLNPYLAYRIVPKRKCPICGMEMTPHWAVNASMHPTHMHLRFIQCAGTTEGRAIKMIINGRPYSKENGYVDDNLITSHAQEEIDVVMNWITENILPRKTPMTECTSYGIKHLLERDTHIYLTNNEFKDAMLMAGYQPVDPDELNWCYCISKKSKAFTLKVR